QVIHGLVIQMLVRERERPPTREIVTINGEVRSLRRSRTHSCTEQLPIIRVPLPHREMEVQVALSAIPQRGRRGEGECFGPNSVEPRAVTHPHLDRKSVV